MILPGVASIPSTESKCFICKKKQRKCIPLNARMDVWVKINVYIPPKNRTCQNHLRNSLFKDEVLPVIKSEANAVCKMSGKEMQNWLVKIKQVVVLKKNPLNFNESMAGWDDKDVYDLLGVSIENFKILLAYIKPHLKNSKKRSIDNCLAIFLMKIRLGVSQKVLAVLFGLKCQSSVSRIIKSVIIGFEKSSFIDDNIGFNHITRKDLFEQHMLKFFTQVLNINEEHLVLILDATYLYIQKPADHKFQRDTYSMHKHRNLVKSMIVACPDGYILSADGLYLANGKNNDANILKSMLLSSNGIMAVAKENDAFIGNVP